MGIQVTMPASTMLLPKGSYRLVVTDWREVRDTGQDGETRPAIQLYLSTDGNDDVPDGVLVYCRLYTRPDCLWKIAAFLKAAGLPVPVGDCELDPDAWKGIAVKAKVATRESAGQTYNVAEQFIVPKAPKQAQTHAQKPA